MKLSTATLESLTLPASLQSWLDEKHNKIPALNTTLLAQACKFAWISSFPPEQEELPVDTSQALLLTQGLETAELLIGITEDSASLAAAIAYPSVHATHPALTLLDKLLGHSVSRLLDGILKMQAIHAIQHKITSSSQHQEQVDKLRKMLLAMVDDVRIVLIKLAERTMTLRWIKPAEDSVRKEIAKETLAIYAPLANRLGVGSLKWQLEDLSFRYLQWDTYKSISKALNMRRAEREEFIEKVKAQIKDMLATVYVEKFEITGRAKHIFSLYRKLSRKAVDLSEIYDASAVRVLVPNIKDCYTVLGLVHTAWKPIPKEFDDYIAKPKPNGYRSIHTAVYGPDGHCVEIQIRTFDMHAEAELGVAAHWIYKEGGHQESTYEKKISWLRQVIDWQKEITETDANQTQLYHDVFDDQLYVFTPTGDVIDLSKGATPLDFAYAIHTDVGHRCRGARVNDKLVPLTTQLKTGDRVEIITGKISQPSRDWLLLQLGYVHTPRAQHKIQHWFKQQDYKIHLAAGNALWEKSKRSHAFSKQQLQQAATALNYKNADDLLVALGGNHVTLHTILQKLEQLHHKDDDAKPKLETESVVTPVILSQASKSSRASPIKVEGVDDLLTHIGQCCKPIPGDPVLGYITKGRGITIHKQSCQNIHYALQHYSDRVVHLHWQNKPLQAYSLDLFIEAIYSTHVLRDISNLLANADVPITAIKSQTDKNQQRCKFELTIEIKDQATLAQLLVKLGQLPSVLQVNRK